MLRNIYHKIKRTALNNLSGKPTINVTKPYLIELQEKNRFKHQVAVVTGGSGAIGRAICCRLAAEGAIVYVCGMTESKINEVVAEIKTQLQGEAYPLKLNVTDLINIETAFAQIIEKHGTIDILVNSAGGSLRGQSNELTGQDINLIKQNININLIGSLACSKEAAKAMKTKKKGRIITISSIIGDHGKAGFTEYAAAKGGTNASVKSLAMELGKYGITVNCVSPGIVQRDEITPYQMEQIKKKNYMNSFGKPEDISNMVAFLASSEASFITGQNFIVDGGRSLGLKGD
ncbi:3-oxoacyl-[acyl-carrier protein] reductase [Draconibacterium orientale]|uniref:3-ketoacyl-ACP reductase n=1 Tax=Draconibacterium orientale TaxID=1168034 RepID=X5DL10_9BACT|nr:SDR family NAD(P)-dependent oxidoreductase [Draconibacterium orientale]AHW61237.1 3-ketoacyl-ACP reductase [Draconibacterium orientale]SET94979.1 3-oxoacyl-[acyl-carrier protein] reductase [Draconibacterium orientale]